MHYSRSQGDTCKGEVIRKNSKVLMRVCEEKIVIEPLPDDPLRSWRDLLENHTEKRLKRRKHWNG